MDTSSEQLAIAIGKALGGGQASAYNGTAFCQGRNHQMSYAISVHPRAFMWTAKELPDGRTRTFDPRRLIIQTDGVDDPYGLSIERIPFAFPEAVQLSFPLSVSKVKDPKIVESRRCLSRSVVSEPCTSEATG